MWQVVQVGDRLELEETVVVNSRAQIEPVQRMPYSKGRPEQAN